MSVKCRSQELNHYMPEIRGDLIMCSHDVDRVQLTGTTLVDRDVYGLAE